MRVSGGAAQGGEPGRTLQMPQSAKLWAKRTIQCMHHGQVVNDRRCADVDEEIRIGRRGDKKGSGGGWLRKS